MLWDVFRIIRMTFSSRQTAVFFQDILYWISCAFLTYIFILTENTGEVRGYIIFGEFLGWVIYFFSLGVTVMKISRAVANFINKFFRFIFKIISAPFKFLFVIFNKIFHRIITPTKKIFKKTKNKSKYSLKRYKVLLYNQLKVSSKAKKKRRKEIREDESKDQN